MVQKQMLGRLSRLQFLCSAHGMPDVFLICGHGAADWSLAYDAHPSIFTEGYYPMTVGEWIKNWFRELGREWRKMTNPKPKAPVDPVWAAMNYVKQHSLQYRVWPGCLEQIRSKDTPEITATLGYNNVVSVFAPWRIRPIYTSLTVKPQVGDIIDVRIILDVVVDADGE
jgi:hypothetical protein